MGWPKGVPRSPEHQEKISKGLRRAYAEQRHPRKHSADTIKKLCAFQQARASHPDYVSPTQKYKPGDKILDPKYGYVMVNMPGYYPRNARLVPEHKLIAEKALGRRMKRGEVVHHVNGEKTDNRKLNLLICSVKYHGELHARMASLYQREHFVGVTP